MNTESTIVIPQPDQLTNREKDDAMGAYLMMFGALGAGLPLPFISTIAAIIYHVLNAKKSPFIGFHSLQSLLTESLLSVLNAIVVVWGMRIWWMKSVHITEWFLTLCIFALIWNLIYALFSIIACINAKNGRFYYFWVIGRIAFRHYFSAAQKNRPQPANLPPQGL